MTARKHDAGRWAVGVCWWLLVVGSSSSSSTSVLVVVVGGGVAISLSGCTGWPDS